MAKVGIIGAGAWGTTLGVLAATNGHEVNCLGRDSAALDRYNAARCNLAYLPDVPLPASLRFTADPAAALEAAEAVVVAVPSEQLALAAAPLAPLLGDPALPICASVKGFIDDKLTRVSQALPDFWGPHPLAVLSGPNLAREILRGDPAVTVVASADQTAVAVFQELLARPAFRVYGSRDVTGVELGGAVKNILAIATGIARGLGYGMNTQAAILARGMAEMTILGDHLGAHRETLLGIAGLGDAVCTALSELSRNVQLGMALARGFDLASALGQVTGVAEGAGTARHVAAYAQVHALDLPITDSVARVVTGTWTVHEAVEALLARTWKMEVT